MTMHKTTVADGWWGIVPEMGNAIALCRAGKYLPEGTVLLYWFRPLFTEEFMRIMNRRDENCPAPRFWSILGPLRGPRCVTLEGSHVSIF